MYCNNCGKKLSKEDFFCSNCGTPVLRQNLFDDQDEDDFADSFEETRVFTAEELGKYLDDVTEEEKNPIDNNQKFNAQNAEPSSPVQNTPFYGEEEYKLDAVASPENISDNIPQNDIKKKVGGFSAFIGGMKERLNKVNDQDESQEISSDSISEAQLDQPVYMDEAIDEGSEDISVDKSPKEKKPSSFKRIVLPVILLGLVIGFVIGLILVQPWDNGEENTDAEGNGEVVAAVELLEE